MGNKENVTWSHFLFFPLPLHIKRIMGKSGTEKPVRGQVAVRV